MNHLERIIEQGNRPLGLARIRQEQPDNNVRCADGFKLSVIAGAGAYCTPRQDDGPFVAVEVCFPSERPEPWNCSAWSEGYDDHAECDGWVKFAESPDDPTGTVYGWVPVEMVRALVEAHGGVA